MRELRGRGTFWNSIYRSKQATSRLKREMVKNKGIKKTVQDIEKSLLSEV